MSSSSSIQITKSVLFFSLENGNKPLIRNRNVIVGVSSVLGQKSSSQLLTRSFHQSRTAAISTVQRAWLTNQSQQRWMMMMITDRSNNSPTTSSNNSYFKCCSSRRFYSSDNKKRDFYQVLGVDRNADKATIKKAYFKLAKQYHPDTNKGDDKAADKFKEATEAYEVLSDDKQREMYNQFGHAGVDPNFQAGGNPFEGFNFGDGSFHFHTSGGQAEIDPEEIFDMFFGAGRGGSRRRNRGPRRGDDLQMHIRLTFQEAVFGTDKDLKLRYQQINRKTGEPTTKEREVTVKVPPGIDNGMNLRLSGQGAEGDPGAPAGNLLVQVLVEPDDYFQRDGYDVHTEVSISFVQAILGGPVDVKTLNGEVELKIPKGCQPSTKLMLRGKGIQELNGTRKGDHIVHVAIEIPKEISKRQEELLRAFENDGKEVSEEDCAGGLGKVASKAFENLFGHKKKNDNGNEKKDKPSKKAKSEQASKNSENKAEEVENEESLEEKKTA